ncbi:MAG: dTDP-4-dehydrorhamnose reductase [Candidatus Omnitrophica bacterium]|nr:dTDP-4-dehydrorhamnose reductase [Candidatus Omnitrophota bacterium]
MKILVTGAAGMLGAEIVKDLIKKGHDVVQTDINQRLPDINALNVTDPGGVSRFVGESSPDYVFHLAAETNVDLCEQDPEHAYRVNAAGTENIVRACSENGAKLLYISTGSVFNGQKDAPYTETDEPDPLSIYGKSKYEGEKAVKDNLKEYFIIRAGWMVGGWELDKKFVYKLVRQIKEGKKELRVVSDKFGCPTFTKDFAANLMQVIDAGEYGLYHMTNKGSCSRYQMAIKLVEFMGKAGKIRVSPISSSEFPLPAPRPRSAVMQNRKLDMMGLNGMPEWEASLEEYIRKNRDKE